MAEIITEILNLRYDTPQEVQGIVTSLAYKGFDGEPISYRGILSMRDRLIPFGGITTHFCLVGLLESSKNERGLITLSCTSKIADPEVGLMTTASILTDITTVEYKNLMVNG